MQANVKSDTTIREIHIEIINGPDLDVGEVWQSKPRVIRVDQVTIRVVDGVTRSIRAYGHLIKKDGSLSESIRSGASWRREDYYSERDRITSAPKWIQELFAGAPTGRVRRDWTPEEVA